MITLVPVNKNNWIECINLSIGEDHQHVAPNVFSIAEAQFYPTIRACCIYHEAVMVGFAMYGLDEDDDHRFWIARLMIAEDQRGQGYGRAALLQILAEARAGGVPAVYLSTHPDNGKAIHLYQSLGFQATGHVQDGEAVFVYHVA